ncbi:hypothetical protein BKA80DRAFT_285985 [Phyllosticta citrichinensis]
MVDRGGPKGSAGKTCARLVLLPKTGRKRRSGRVSKAHLENSEGGELCSAVTASETNERRDEAIHAPVKTGQPAKPPARMTAATRSTTTRALFSFFFFSSRTAPTSSTSTHPFTHYPSPPRHHIEGGRSGRGHAMPPPCSLLPCLLSRPSVRPSVR